MGFTVSGANTYSGGTTLGAMSGDGVVVATASSVFTGPTLTSGTFGTGTLSIGATKMRGGNVTPLTIGNAITFVDNPTFVTTGGEKSIIFSGNASLNGATRTLTVETGSTVATEDVEFSGEISGTGFGITKEGAGNLLLSGTNTYTGDTTVNAGTLALIGGSQASAITVKDGASIAFDITAPTTSSAAVILDAGHKISVSGSPTSASYTLLTTSATITGIPNLDPPIAGYDLAVDGGNTLKLVSNISGTFAAWISNPAFGLALADQDLFDDPDGDGIDNGVENFFGTHPGGFSQGLLAEEANPLAGTFTFVHPRNASPATDLTAIYRWSTDLATFHLDGEPGSGITVSFIVEENTPAPGLTRVTATVSGPPPERLFFDVKVTGP
jgi:autotransporter-associated beta strand protein